MSDEKNEPISAKLRRWAEECEKSLQFSQPSTFARKDFGIYGSDVSEMNCRMFRRIADEIDAEKREITERYARQSWMNPADAIAKLATGEIEWAELRQAIDRYYLPRPLFEDGEPVCAIAVIAASKTELMGFKPENYVRGDVS